MDEWGQTVLLWQRLRRPILIEEGITHADKRIFYGLYHTQEVTKKELAKRVVLEHSSLTRSLERLEKQDFIKRVTNPDDRRSIQLSLTEKGFKKVTRIKSRSRKLFKTMLSGIPNDELEQAMKAFQQLKNAMETTMKKT